MVGCYSKVTSNRHAKQKSGGFDQPDLYKGGVRNILLLPNERILLGTGDGTVELIELIQGETGNERTEKTLILPRILTIRSGNVCGATTSMVLYKDDSALIGTVGCEIYEIRLSNFSKRLIVTCHTSQIYDIAFPRNRSDVFATAGRNDVRLWSLRSQKELLRITVPNFLCTNLCFDGNDRGLISAWNDGVIRGFVVRNGDLAFEIQNGHAKPVSAVTVTMDGGKIVSGGCDGQVKVWDAKSSAHRLLHVLKEHRGPITCLRISRDDVDLVSSSTDGTCIIWDAKSFTRKFVLMGNTMFMAACFTPDGVQVLTCGTDRKIAYWETIDGSLVREIEGSTGGTLNCIDIDVTGKFFLTGSDDCTIKLWDYKQGNVLRFSVAHAAAVTAIRFAPDNKTIVTASADGTIMIWSCPE